MEQVYDYLTGTKFRQRVEAVVEKFNDMRDDLDRERKFMGRQWAKRETQIQAVIDSTVGMVGDLQAIAGKAIPEISSLDLPLLESGIGSNVAVVAPRPELPLETRSRICAVSISKVFVQDGKAYFRDRRPIICRGICCSQPLLTGFKPTALAI